MTTSTYRILGLTSCLAVSAVLGGYAGQAQAQQAPPLPIATPQIPGGIPGMPSGMPSGMPNIQGMNLPQIDPSQFAINPQEFLQGAQSVQNVMSMLQQGGQNTPSQIAQALSGLGGMAGIDTSQITEATQILQGLQGMMQNGQINPAAVQNILGGVMGGQMPEGLGQMMESMGNSNTGMAALGETLNGLFGGGGTGTPGGGGGSSGGGTGGGSGSGGSKDDGNYELESKPVDGGGAFNGCESCSVVGNTIKQHYTAVRQVIKNKFIEHREWIVTEYWKKHILPALMLMAEQLTVVGIQQVEMFGTMLDAKHQLETQRLFQQMTAQAHKDYHPSEGMCTFGTTVRSLAASERKSDMTQVGVAGRMMQRQALSGDTVSYMGPASDIESRLVYFAYSFCDKADNSNGLQQLCKNSKIKPARRNIDVDYTRNIEGRLTLDIDFNDPKKNRSSGEAIAELDKEKQELDRGEKMLEKLNAFSKGRTADKEVKDYLRDFVNYEHSGLSDEQKKILKESLDSGSADAAMNEYLKNFIIPNQESVNENQKEAIKRAEQDYAKSLEYVDREDVFALSANLFAHKVAPRFVPEQLATGDGRVKLSAAEKYMDLRAVFAKRSVAQNSFAALTAMRSSGDDGSAPYTKALIKELGVADEDEINELLGEKPSYFAQMEVLTKKIYQNPTFYTELYDKPVNVERKGAAIQAISLMQDRDLYNSLIRSEAVLSVLLETMLMREQQKVLAGMPRDTGAGGK